MGFILDSTFYGALGLGVGIALKTLFYSHFMQWLRNKPNNKLAQLLLYGERRTASSSTSTSKPQ